MYKWLFLVRAEGYEREAEIDVLLFFVPKTLAEIYNIIDCPELFCRSLASLFLPLLVPSQFHESIAATTEVARLQWALKEETVLWRWAKAARPSGVGV